MAALASILALAGCDLPRDPAGTMDRVERTGTLRLGLVDGAQLDERSRRTLDVLAERTGAQPQVTRGDSEALLGSLKHGRLDLVYGRFAADSPWSREVHFGKAQGWLASPPRSEPVPRFAAMNGENGWIMQIAEASR